LREEYGKDNRKLLPLLNGIGQIYAEMGRFPDAEAAFAQAINILQASQKSYRPRDIEVVENYAQLLLRLGKQAESGQYAALALHLRQKLNSMPTLVKLATVLAPSTSMDARRFQHLVEQTADTAELLPATKRIRWRPILIVLLIAAWTAWALFLIF